MFVWTFEGVMQALILAGLIFFILYFLLMEALRLIGEWVKKKNFKRLQIAIIVLIAFIVWIIGVVLMDKAGVLR